MVAVPARPLVVAVGVILSLAVAGCGATQGQGDALQACKSYTDATTGYVTAAHRDSALADAAHWAAKAAAGAAAWQPLLEAIQDYQKTLAAPDPRSPGVVHRRDAAYHVINGSCATASRGY